MSRVCSQCGGKSFHFSPQKRSIVCDVCGHIYLTESEENSSFDYERQLQLAHDHLLVGNWSEAERIANRFLYDKPANKELYEIQLAAITKNYSEAYISDPQLRSRAADIWEKRSRLGSLSCDMESYQTKRRKKCAINDDVKTFFLILLVIICAIIMGFTAYYIIVGEMAMALIPFGVGLLLLGACYKLRIAELTGPSFGHFDGNPFHY